MESGSKKIVKSSEIGKKIGSRPADISFDAESRIIGKEEIKAKTKVEKILDAAQKEADRIRAEAEALRLTVQVEMERAKQKGYAEGKEEGSSELAEEIVRVRKLKEKFFANAEPDVLKLVMDIAEKVIGKLAAQHKEAIHAIVHQALERSLGDKIVVRLHPADLKRLQTMDLNFKDILDRTKHLHFKEDETIQQGGCVVETEIGTIDAQLETQLKAIKKALGV
ncbi:MAG: FliH/SctL family protein [Deltaproteobacteria bacterium]|nr:FliH/SctL family protein [Deltaproteobacteria bacterium]